MSISLKLTELDDFFEKLKLADLSSKDIIEWLESNTSDIAKLKSIDISDFIPQFISHVKNKCSWLCRNDKTSDISTGDKAATPKSNETKIVAIKSPVEQNRRFAINDPPRNSPPLNNHNGSFNNSPRENGRRVPLVTINPANYKPKQNVFNPKISQRAYDGSNSNTFPLNVVDNRDAYLIQKYNNNNYHKANTNHYVKPIYNNKFNAKSFVSNESPRLQNFNNMEAFPPLGAKSTDIKTRRRITPTPVQSSNNVHHKFGKSHFTPVSDSIQNDVFKSSTFQESDPDLQQERELLKATKNTLPIQPTTPERKICNLDSKQQETKSTEGYIYPDPVHITMMQDILFYSEIFSFLLQKSLVPNITSELYFLFELIASRASLKDIPTEKGTFSSVHNCVFFAVSVLCDKTDLLQILDKATLASLLEIPYLLIFSPQLVHYLNMPSLLKHDAALVLPSMTVVPFQVEEDSRVNFPDDYSFISFKKQRDLFYDMLREWQQQPDSTDDRFQGTFVRKARQLITLNPSSINMFHLAKLFQSQLVTSCMGLEVNDVYDELLNDIQKNFPDKFKKLQERFLTPSCAGGLTPPPSFYGIQTFFAELITAAGSLSLNQHLINMFVFKILELNSSDIFSDGELNSPNTIRDKYIFLLHTLRLLGKFLGYVYFLPYAKEEDAPDYIAKQQLASREYSSTPLNLQKLLEESISLGHTVLTVPWVVEFLSMVDPLGKNLKNVQGALNILSTIYRYNTFPSHNIHSYLFLQVVIGWLFGILHYPSNFHMLLQPMDLSSQSLDTGIDTLCVIDKQLIHSCCPFLIEFKVLVYNFINGIRGQAREVRKITPVSTVTTNNSKKAPISKYQLEHNLEENFFSLHPTSVKKTTEFVSERMASKVISKIRMKVTEMKLDIAENVINDEQIKSSILTDPAAKKQYIDEILHKKITAEFKNIKNQISISLENIRLDTNTIVPTLLSDGTREKVVEYCCKISFRMSVDKVMEWCNANLLLEPIKNDIANKVQHASKHEINESLSPSAWMSYVRNTVAKIHSKSYKFDHDSINSLCSKLAVIISRETSEFVKKTFISLSIDLCIALIRNYPEKCCENICKYFVQFWKKCPRTFNIGKSVFSPQNIKFISTGCNVICSYEKFICLIKMILSVKLMSIEEFSVIFNNLTELKVFKHMDSLERNLKQLL